MQWTQVLRIQNNNNNNNYYINDKGNLIKIMIIIAIKIWDDKRWWCKNKQEYMLTIIVLKQI